MNKLPKIYKRNFLFIFFSGNVLYLTTVPIFAWTTVASKRQANQNPQTSALFSGPNKWTESSPSTAIGNSTDNIHLLSLKWTPDDCISKPVRDVWKWKDSALGDGRDFFVPKPKTITLLQDFVMQHSPCMKECLILSNCARLEIICVTESANDDPVLDVSQSLAAQLTSSQRKKRPMFAAMLTQHMDLPGIAIDENAPVISSETADAISLQWVHLRGAESICRHLCLVAAGMADRPRRLERQVVFRPFSSRDAHILLQLKRTKEVANGKHVNQLLEYALRAGKAARTVEKVPELELLRDYGSGDSKYSAEPPKQLSLQVAEVGLYKNVTVSFAVR
jgi:hypothetical protein